MTEPKGRWLGGDPKKGYASVGQMPGAPGINDRAIFAAQRERTRALSAQQFDKEDPYEADLANMAEAKPTTDEDFSVARHMEQQRVDSLSEMERPVAKYQTPPEQMERIRRHIEIYGSDPT